MNSLELWNLKNLLGKKNVSISDDYFTEFYRGSNVPQEVQELDKEWYYMDGGVSDISAAFGNHLPRWELMQGILPYYNAYRLQGLDNALVDNGFWNSLDPYERSAIQSLYETEVKDFRNLWGLMPGKQYAADEEALLADLAELSKITPFDTSEPLYGDYVQKSSDLYSSIDSELAGAYNAANARLDEEQSFMRQDYLDQLNANASMYDRQASNLLSNQYLANAQTYDALQSDMRKSRQNALEAGASAGIRLAGNVNALLSAQNKQSQTALDTSNALADMLLQQRNAAAGIRSDYRNYMSDYNQRKTDLDTQRRTERENLYNQRHNAQVDDYNIAREDYDRKLSEYNKQFDNATSSGNLVASKYQNYLNNK